MQSAGRVFTHSAPFNPSRRFSSFRFFGVFAILLALLFITAPVFAYQSSGRMALYANWEVHASGTGPNFTHTWGLINNTSCPINNFTLGNPQVYQWTAGGFTPSSASVSGSYSSFSLSPHGGTGSVTANFCFFLDPADTSIYRIFFDMITDDGVVLPYINGNATGYGRLFTDVGSTIGNFVQQESDATVAGPGDSTIRLNRTYNSQAVLWTPASRVRFYPDGSSEVMAEPPQYFGKGWTSELGQYLLEIDMAPTFEGVQILYPDGHTANFKKSGSQYISASPGTHDVISREGDEYVMRDADCGCASEEKRVSSPKSRVDKYFF